jgi:myosin heavy subunit
MRNAGYGLSECVMQVTYNVDGFLEKNRDTLSENVAKCMRNSEARLVFELFSPVSDFGQLQLR